MSKVDGSYYNPATNQAYMRLFDADCLMCADLRQQLAAAEARERELRDTFRVMSDGFVIVRLSDRDTVFACHKDAYKDIADAYARWEELNEQPPTAALDAALAEARRETRERCTAQEPDAAFVKAAWLDSFSLAEQHLADAFDEGYTTGWADYQNTIRALEVEEGK